MATYLVLFNILFGSAGVNITTKSFTNIATDANTLVNKERAVDALFFEPFNGDPSEKPSGSSQSKV
jgi:hypothetical protein